MFSRRSNPVIYWLYFMKLSSMHYENCVSYSEQVEQPIYQLLVQNTSSNALNFSHIFPFTCIISRLLSFLYLQGMRLNEQDSQSLTSVIAFRISVRFD